MWEGQREGTYEVEDGVDMSSSEEEAEEDGEEDEAHTVHISLSRDRQG
jgi:hypothetical protein